MPQARLLLEQLRKCRITHVVSLPDNTSAALLALLAADAEICLVPVTREGEAFALATGLWIGGKNPAVLIQNTGLLESGDSFRGTAQRMRIPMICLITYRGYAGITSASERGSMEDADIDARSRADLDSTALATEPTLRSWGLPYDLLESDSDMAKVSDLVHQAQSQCRPVALLIAQPLV
jgi:sulfopyruvate decarboxylase TPP-binding subunit